MIVVSILSTKDFQKEFRGLPDQIKHLAIEKEQLFRDNPLHPSLRLHPLKGKLDGLWSISITLKYRIIFERQDNGDILLISIGAHDVYKST
ncbi:MAG: type II toxin-antitoxin system mRNA interferase toxin, RelE/StbE family [Patescibacteria group bacterium]